MLQRLKKSWNWFLKINSSNFGDMNNCNISYLWNDSSSVSEGCYDGICQNCGCDNGTYEYVCGENITESCTMTCNLTYPTTCFNVGVSDISINGAGYSIAGNHYEDEASNGISINDKNNITISIDIIQGLKNTYSFRNRRMHLVIHLL